MRIALFSDTYPPEINGVSNSTHILREELEKHGHEVYVVTTYAGVGEYKWEGNILRLAGVKLKSFYGYIMTSPFHVFALGEIEKLNLDVIHVQTEFGVGIFARICANQLGIPLVSTYHTTYEDYTHYVNIIDSQIIDDIAKAGVARLSKVYSDCAMVLIAPSQKTKEMLERYKICREIDVIPTGLMLDAFSPKHKDMTKTLVIREKYGFKPDEKLVIYLGRLAQEKSLDLVVKGFKKAIDHGTDAKLIIVGGGPDLKPLQELVKTFNIENNIKVIGPVLKDEVYDYYRAADLFISASLTETQGMTYIEALASGLPIMVRRDEVVKELVDEGKTGFYFDDEDSLADLLKEIYAKDTADFEAMKDSCVEKAVPYSSETFYERVLNVYERAIDSYKHQYSIEDVKVKDGSVQLYLISNQKEELRLSVSVDDFYSYGMRTNGILVSNQVELLKQKEEKVIAYQKCLKRIALKDRTRKEIYDWLTQNTDCVIEDVNDIVDILEEKGFINDVRYCSDQVARLKATLTGREKIIRTLMKKGIPYDIIVHQLDDEPDDELQNAIMYAGRILSYAKDESVRKTKANLYTKMTRQGYSSEIIQQAISALDFSRFEIGELTTLKKYISKAKKKYERKYTGTELRNHVYRYCAAQGFKSEDIYAAMDRLSELE